MASETARSKGFINNKLYSGQDNIFNRESSDEEDEAKVMEELFINGIPDTLVAVL